MALSKKLRDEICKRLDIKRAAFYNRIHEKASESGILDLDVAGLLLAHEKKIDIRKPRFEVPLETIQALQEQLNRQNKTVIMSSTTITQKKSKGKMTTKAAPLKRFLKFEGKYPSIFYNRLEREINHAYSSPDLPNVVLILSRKLVENLLYNLMQKQFHGKDILLYFDPIHSRARDFSVLLDNLNLHKNEFSPDLHGSIEKFLSLAHSFRLDANAKTHNVIEYLEKMSQIKEYKIAEMTQLLLNLIDGVS